jgi:hypothetical protein
MTAIPTLRQTIKRVRLKARPLVGIRGGPTATSLPRGSWEIMHGRGGGMPRVILLVFGTARSKINVIVSVRTNY